MIIINPHTIFQLPSWVTIIVQVQHPPNHHNNQQNQSKKYFHIVTSIPTLQQITIILLHNYIFPHKLQM